MKIYTAVNSECIDGNDKSFYVLGTYSTREKAMKCLEEQADADKQSYELRDYKRTETKYGFIISTECADYEYYIVQGELDDDEEDSNG